MEVISVSITNAVLPSNLLIFICVDILLSDNNILIGIVYVTVIPCCVLFRYFNVPFNILIKYLHIVNPSPWP
jgi:hypothetical protein